MHVILYVLDALRADHLGCYGYQRETSPHIDQIAADGVVFENCFTSTTWTRPVASSILTGVYPAVHRTRSRSEMLSADLVRLPELLQALGFKTAAFCTMGNIAGDIGFNRGFDHYFDLFRDPEILEKRKRLDTTDEALLHGDFEDEIALPLAEDVNPKLFQWLDENGHENTFNFIWSIETHVPYEAPAEFRKFSPKQVQLGEGDRDDIRGATAKDAQRIINLYDDEIVYNDHCIGDIVAYLKENNLYDETMIVIIGDHGEAFYEHGVYAHGHAPYEEVINVPLVVKMPNNEHAGQRVNGLAELIDLFPTIVSVADPGNKAIETNAFLQGHNLIPLVTGEKDEVRTYSFSDTQTLEVHNRYLSVRGQRWKYIRFMQPKRDGGTVMSTLKHIQERKLLGKIVRNPMHFLRNYFRSSNELLFDLSVDPTEQTNVIEQNQGIANQMRYALESWMTENEDLASQVGESAESYQESDELRQHLEKLGYL